MYVYTHTYVGGEEIKVSELLTFRIISEYCTLSLYLYYDIWGEMVNSVS